MKTVCSAPAELEALLITHPSVADAIVIPRPDVEAGEVPRAYVVKRLGAPDVTAEELAHWIEREVAPHKKLRGGIFFELSLPKTASGEFLCFSRDYAEICHCVIVKLIALVSCRQTTQA